MKLPRLLWVVLLLFLTTPAWSQPAAKSDPEKEKIESLIHHLETLKETSFIRNGSTYDAKTAAKFLRTKWERDKTVKTAADFIQKCATISSTSGKPYLIRFKDGKEVKCGDYLTEQLKKLEAPPADSAK